MSESASNISRTVAAWVQVAVFAIGLGSLAVSIGRKDAQIDQHGQQLSELKGITSDLVRSQLSLAGNTQVISQRLQDLERRMASLEAPAKRQ
jgi:hypothetical protein